MGGWTEMDMGKWVGGRINGWVSVSHVKIHPLLAERSTF